MYQISQHDGIPRQWHQIHVGEPAQGGFGAITVEATAVVPEGRITPHDLGLWNDQQRDAFKDVTSTIKSFGATPAIQLAHAGRKAGTFPAWGQDQEGSIPLAQGGWRTMAPSALAFPGLAEPQAMTKQQIGQVVQAFADAAQRAAEAGFEILEIHGAHGYLLHEFLSPTSNHRDDEYGGPLENRARLTLEVVDAVRAVVDQGIAVTIRLSVTDWNQGPSVKAALHKAEPSDQAWDLPDAIVLGRWLKERGVDLISVSSGGNQLGVKIPIGPGYQVPLATQIRDAVPVPVSTAGLIVTPAQAEQIVATELADVVLLGREALRNPRFPLQAAADQRLVLPYAPPQYARAY